MAGRVLLTGATGFVGRQIYKHLLEKNVDIRLIVRPRWRRKIDFGPQNPDIFETDDMFGMSAKGWSDCLTDVDIILHAAWFVEPGVYLTSPKNIDCLQGTLDLAKAACRHNVRRFVGLGTCIEYEISEQDLRVETPLAATTLYSAAKLSLFHTCTHLFKDRDVSFLWGRLFYLYGEGEDPRRFTAFLRQKMEAGERADLTSGTQIRDFMDVSDAGKRIVDLTLASNEGAANICTGEGRTIRAIAEEIADQYGRRDLLNFGARPDNLVDPPRIVGVPTRPI